MRIRVRVNRKRYELVSRGGTFGAANKGWIVFGDGEKLVEQRKAERIHSPDTGKLIGYQLTCSEARSPNPQPTLSVSEAVLTPEETDAVVGEHFKCGKSQTASLNARQRKVREVLGLETVDFIERSRIKLNAFDPRNGRTVKVEAVA